MNNRSKALPKIGSKILRYLIRSKNYDAATGDFLEVYNNIANEKSTFRAWLWFWFQILTSFPRFVSNSAYWGALMLKCYTKITLRNLSRYRIYSLINISGLSIGLASFLLILVFIDHEFSYDKFFKNYQQIYRVTHTRTRDSSVSSGATMPVPLGLELKRNYADIAEMVRFWRAFEPVVGFGEKRFKEFGFYFTDPSVFNLFSFDFIRGNPESALANPNSIVVTEETAIKYFGDTNAIGKTLQFNGYPGDGLLNFTVTGVLRDLPQNTHFDFDFLASLNGITTEISNWGSFKPIWTYVELHDNITPELLENKFPEFVSKYLAPGWSSNIDFRLNLEPLSKIHLYSESTRGFKPGSSINYIYFLSIIGLAVLLISSINYMNLSTARSQGRYKEIGMRKVFGSNRKNIFFQFISEAVIISLFSMMIAFILAISALPLFNELTGKQILTSYIFESDIIFTLLVLTLLTGLISGIYPAVTLSGLQPIEAIKNRVLRKMSGVRIRQSLVIFQFAVSCLLIISTLLVFKQIHYLRNKNLGFAKENVLVVPYSDMNELFIREILEDPGIINASVSQRVPVNVRNGDRRPVIIEGAQDPIQVESYIIDERFIETYDLKIIAGRNFSKDLSSDGTAFVLNESAVKQFGWISPDESIGKEIDWGIGQIVGQVIGVVEDFHLESLHRKIEPLVLQMLPDESWWKTFISIRIQPENTSESLSLIENTWRNFSPDGAYSYYFVDQSYEQLYNQDAKFGQLFTYFTAITIFIACLGLFGLCSFNVEKRKKEIGIRKVLGASIPKIVLMIYSEFAFLILISIFISFPAAYYFIKSWLESFAYKTEIGWMIFLISGIAALAVAFLTVVYQAVKAGLANPTDSLRCE